MATKRADKGNVYDWITERIIAALEAGVVPWRRPWLLQNAAKSLATGKPYRGVNIWALAFAGEQYTSSYWVTFVECRKRGGRVRKGQKSSMIVVYKPIGKTENGKPVLNSKGKQETVPMLRYHDVFNVEQCDNLDYPKPETNRLPVDSLEVCENIIGAFTDCPTIEHKGDRAFYRQSDDSVTMPKRDTFDGSPEYYSTLFHELGHATGHKSRLNRKLESRFGSSDYAREELIAEMTAAFLCGVAGIECKTIDNSAAYIDNWLRALKNDSRLIVKASSQAQKSAEYIQGIEAPKYESESESERSDKSVALAG